MGHRSGMRAFLLAFVTVVLAVGVAPLAGLALRFAALGEFDVYASDATLLGHRLYGPFDLPTHRYKYRMSALRKPRLLIVGSSNVLTFRRSAFTECGGACFYNAGGGMPTTRVGADLVRRLIADGAAPEAMLLGVDLWFFNPSYEENTHAATRLTSTLEDEARLVLGVTRAFAPRILAEPDVRELVLGLRAAPAGSSGVRAILRSEGYRGDGSYAWGTVAEAHVLGLTPAERSADVIGRIAEGCCRFQRFTEPDPRSVAELGGLLDAALGADVKVVAFNVPLSDEVMDALERDPAQRAALERVRESVRAVTARRGVPFVWTARPSDAGCPRSEMLDGFHPSEVCSARIVRRLMADADAARVLRPFLDPAVLSSKLARPVSDLSLDGE